MKIISTYKDYYDYLSGIYGEDPLKILDRREVDPSDNIRTIVFCDKIYIKGLPEHVFKSRDNTLRYADKEGKYFISDYYNIEIVYMDDEVVWFNVSKEEFLRRNWLKKDYFDKITKPYYIPGFSKKEFPILKNIGFNKVMSAKDAYIAIENYISKKDIEMDSNPDNMIRYEQKGFDIKKSFRKKQSL